MQLLNFLLQSNYFSISLTWIVQLIGTDSIHRRWRYFCKWSENEFETLSNDAVVDGSKIRLQVSSEVKMNNCTIYVKIQKWKIKVLWQKEKYKSNGQPSIKWSVPCGHYHLGTVDRFPADETMVDFRLWNCRTSAAMKMDIRLESHFDDWKQRCGSHSLTWSWFWFWFIFPIRPHWFKAATMAGLIGNGFIFIPVVWMRIAMC